MIDAFNQAAGFARAGEYERSLAAWNELLEPSQPRTGSPMVTGEFLGIAQMRRAWVLMDLKRYAEARKCFEAELMQACLSQFEMSSLYDYFFAYGNTLGELGDIEAMDDAFSRALGIAAEELSDVGRCEQVWRWIVRHAQTAEAWPYLEREAPSLIRFGENVGHPGLVRLGQQALQEALDHQR